MIKRTVEISGSGTRFFLKNDQIVLKRKGEKIGQIPSEDIGIMIIDCPDAVYTHASLVRLAEQGCVVVFCGSNHLPISMVLPYAANSLIVKRLSIQLKAGVPKKKRLWQQIVQQKILNQAANLNNDFSERTFLLTLAKRVRSGDPDNLEAQAARHYWKFWLHEQPFQRDRNGPPPNNLLNYGYAIIRAAVARAICGAGLNPSIGLHHKNRGDAFCLASDIMEPLRPLVDRVVRGLHLEGIDTIDKESKKRILMILAEPIELFQSKGPLLVELQRTAASLVRCFEGNERRLELPKLLKVTKHQIAV